MTTPTVESPTLLSKITDRKALRNLGIVCFQSSDIQAITKNSGPLTTSNEYQVHYWFLNGRFKFDEKTFIDIAIPTVYFNYEQQVSVAAVDFELEDVDVMSEALQPVHNSKVAEIMANEKLMALVETLTLKFNIDITPCAFEWIGLNLGTIHKHPGNLSTFSGTDLSTSVTSPGICYPFGPIGSSDVLHKPSFSSIMLHKTNRTVIGRTEYRTATSPSPKTVAYEKHRCISLIQEAAKQPGLITKFLGEQPIGMSYITTDYLTEEHLETMGIHDLILDALEDSGYTANTTFIKADNISEIRVTELSGWPLSGSKWGYGGKNSKTTTSIINQNKKVPHRNSKEWRKTAADIADFFGVELVPYSVLITKSRVERADYYEELHEAVFAKEVDADPTTLLPMDIIALQEKIWIETRDEATFGMALPSLDPREIDDPTGLLDLEDIEDQDAFMEAMAESTSTDEDKSTLTLTDMRSDLLSWGVNQAILAKSSAEQIVDIWIKASS